MVQPASRALTDARRHVRDVTVHGKVFTMVCTGLSEKWADNFQKCVVQAAKQNNQDQALYVFIFGYGKLKACR